MVQVHADFVADLETAGRLASLRLAQDGMYVLRSAFFKGAGHIARHSNCVIAWRSRRQFMPEENFETNLLKVIAAELFFSLGL